jgi:hypothetical protein
MVSHGRRKGAGEEAMTVPWIVQKTPWYFRLIGWEEFRRWVPRGKRGYWQYMRTGNE